MLNQNFKIQNLGAHILKSSTMPEWHQSEYE